jgi:hypothetical protein
MREATCATEASARAVEVTRGAAAATSTAAITPVGPTRKRKRGFSNLT